MKQFFKFVLATLVGLFLFWIIAFFVFGGFVATAVSKSLKNDNKVEISANSILRLNLNTPINDRPFTEGDFFNEFLPVNTNGNLGLKPVIEAIEKAKNDDEIRGIYLELDVQPTGFANLGNLVEALRDFKSSGKFIVANSRFITEKAYALASVADEVYLHPEGYFDFKGLSSQRTFVKGALDKLGVEPMIFYAGKFKSATEPLRRTNMSEESKLQTREFLEDIYGNYLEMVAENRNKSVAELRDIADNMKVRQPEDAVSLGLIDGLKYDDEIDAILREKLGFEEDKEIDFISLNDYSEARKINAKGSVTGNNRIAVVYAEGSIVMGDGKGNNDAIAGDQYLDLLKKIRKNDKIKAVVLRVNSPGGSAFASDLIWRELELIKKDKPVVVSMGNYAASGGYYIACNADKIYAEENTITGSIGVFGMMFNMRKLMENKLGITTDGISTGKYSDFPNPMKEWSAEEKAIFQAQIDNIYDDFIGKVAEGRGLNIEQVHEIAQGRVWSGQDAIGIGLVDEIGSIDDAIEYAAGLAEVDDYKLSVYPRVKSEMERIMELFDIETRMEKKIKNNLGELGSTYELLNTLEQARQPQMRMPYDLEIK